MKDPGPGVTVIRQGSSDRWFYVLLNGEVEVAHVNEQAVEVVVTRLGAQSSFGQAALGPHVQPRVASVRTATARGGSGWMARPLP